MSEVNLGFNPDENACRDAIHVAVIPLVAGEDLWTGRRVKLAFGSNTEALCADYNEDAAIGIVDPFRSPHDYIRKGGRFWCFLMPNSVTGMRHHWQHPKFDREPKQAINEHELWIRRFCDEWNIDYGQLIDAATNAGSDWRYATAMGNDLHHASDLGEDHDLFWHHLEKLMGQTYSPEHRAGMGWSCSC